MGYHYWTYYYLKIRRRQIGISTRETFTLHAFQQIRIATEVFNNIMWIFSHMFLFIGYFIDPNAQHNYVLTYFTQTRPFRDKAIINILFMQFQKILLSTK